MAVRSPWAPLGPRLLARAIERPGLSFRFGRLRSAKSPQRGAGLARIIRVQPSRSQPSRFQPSDFSRLDLSRTDLRPPERWLARANAIDIHVSPIVVQLLRADVGTDFRTKRRCARSRGPQSGQRVRSTKHLLTDSRNQDSPAHGNPPELWPIRLSSCTFPVILRNTPQCCRVSKSAWTWPKVIPRHMQFGWRSLQNLAERSIRTGENWQMCRQFMGFGDGPQPLRFGLALGQMAASRPRPLPSPLRTHSLIAWNWTLSMYSLLPR